MGFWAGIKHALNSTLGTENFQPLDKIIKGQRTLAGSDDVVAVISNSLSSAVGGGYVFPASFVAKTKGVVRVLVQGSVANTTNVSDLAKLKVLRDGSTVKDFNFYYSSTNNTKTFSADIAVEEGSELSFATSGEDFKCSYIRIGAGIVDGSLFEVKETT